MNKTNLYFENVQSVLIVMIEIMKSIRKNIHVSLETVSSSLISLQNQIEREAAESTTALEQAFMKSGEILKIELDQTQAQVDNVFELAAAQNFQDCDSTPNISRKGSEFTKSVEAMSLLNDTLTTELLRLMGTLSEEDVILQRLESTVLLCGTLLSFLEGISVQSMPVDMQGARTLRDKARTFFKSTEERWIMTRAGLDEVIPDNALKSGSKELFIFCQRYLTMVAMLSEDILSVYSTTMEKTNSSVLEMASLASGSVDHAQMRMLKTEKGFTNIKVSNHDFWMKHLESASAAMTQAIFSLMGVLSEGDVSCQRLFAVSVIAKRIANYSDLMAINFATAEQAEILRLDILSVFVTEEDKRIYRSIFGKIDSHSA